SPDEMLAYLDTLALPGTFILDWDVIDSGAYYTIVEESPFKVTTVAGSDELLAHLNTLAGTLKIVVPKGSGMNLTYYSTTDETLGATNNYTMQIAVDDQTLEDALNAVGAKVAEIEHKNYTIILS
ncbi:unnamed protein product, partial [marine sediment metagenome]